jgi:hypothetical protein
MWLRQIRSAVCSLKRFIHTEKERLLYLVFLNSLGVRVNLIWKIHYLYCWYHYVAFRGRLKNKNGAIANEFRAKGFVNLGVLDMSELSSDIENTFRTLQPDHLGQIVLPREPNERLAIQIYNILSINSEKIESILNSHFQCYWIRSQKNLPIGIDSKEASYGFHTDDNPRELFKIFFYLNDTCESNAAFRTFNYDKTRKLLKKGFRSYSVADRDRAQCLITKQDLNELNVLEGSAGTVLMFDNNLIHKGTVPVVGYRSIFQIEIYPSNKKLTLSNVKKSIANQIGKDYPSNPFVNEFN